MSGLRGDVEGALKEIGVYSRYLERLSREDRHRQWLLEGGGAFRRYPLIELYRELRKACDTLCEVSSLKYVLREFKQRHFLRLGLMDFMGSISFEEMVASISALAEVCLQVLLERCLSKDGALLLNLSPPGDLPCSLVILGFGKLGGRELNFVSDIDIVYLYSCKGRGSRDNTFYTKVAQIINHIMEDTFEGDRVFKVDNRLRPGGKDSPLVPSVEGAVEYYLLSGSPWERQALLKARGVAGDRKLAGSFLKEIRPFIFRRFLDFQAIDEIRSMRDRILRESESLSGGKRDVKLGPGGIREIEFIVQSLQLIYGGRYPELNETNTLSCLKRLKEIGILKGGDEKELAECYIFLRRVEHWIQLDKNRQWSKLPSGEEDLVRLSKVMGFAGDPKAFLKRYEEVTHRVHLHFKELFSPEKHISPSTSAPPGLSSLGSHIYLSGLSPAFQRSILQILKGLEQGLSPGSQKTAMSRLSSYFKKITPRKGLVRYVERHPQEVGRVLNVMYRSKFIYDILMAQPALIEGVVESFSLPPGDWMERARRIVEGLPFEEAMEWVRRIKNERILFLATEDISGRVSLPELLVSLSRLADFIIQITYDKVLAHLGENRDYPLGIIALGKLGSYELGYFSDLDMMFVYEPGKGEDPDIIPDRAIKIVQRLTRMLRTPLQDGPGYEVDTRLRPTGNYGPLIVTSQRWMQYYRDEADIWELQSLIRFRPVAGRESVMTPLEGFIREELFEKEMPENMVWKRVVEMRRRIEEERAQEEGSEVLDLKLGRGGMVEIEFLTQACVLTSSFFPQKKDTLSLIELLKEGLGLSRENITLLKQALLSYHFLIQRIHLLTNLGISRLDREHFTTMKEMGLLGNFPYLQDWEDIIKYRKVVRRIWEGVINKKLKAEC